MPDANRVIKGYTVCVEHGRLNGEDCHGYHQWKDNHYEIEKINDYSKECPYNGCETGCMKTLKKDVLFLLKEQEAEIKRLKGELHGFGDLFHTLSEKTKEVMEEQPDIVRCKECKHRSKELYDYYGNPNNKRYVCQIIDVAKKPDWFCGDGERGEPECEPEW